MNVMDRSFSAKAEAARARAARKRRRTIALLVAWR